MSGEVKLEKWMEDAARELSDYEPIRQRVVDAIARHFAARERDVQELVKVLEWLDRRGGLGLDAHEYIRKALAPFTAPAASRGEEQS